MISRRCAGGPGRGECCVAPCSRRATAAHGQPLPPHLHPHPPLLGLQVNVFFQVTTEIVAPQTVAWTLLTNGALTGLEPVTPANGAVRCAVSMGQGSTAPTTSFNAYAFFTSGGAPVFRVVKLDARCIQCCWLPSGQSPQGTQSTNVLACLVCLQA